jgi:hypothetical protein
MQNQYFQTDEEPQQKEYKRKFLTLRVHHLSFYEIELEYKYGKPANIGIRFVMENHHDTPSPENNKPIVKHNCTLLYQKSIKHDANFQIFYNRSNEFIISNTGINDYHVVCNNPHEDVEKFDELFTQLEFNIDHILALNKDIKEYKEHRRSDRKHDKFSFPVKKGFYKSKLKQLEAERSEAKKELRNILIKLYS